MSPVPTDFTCRYWTLDKCQGFECIFQKHFLLKSCLVQHDHLKLSVCLFGNIFAIVNSYI